MISTHTFESPKSENSMFPLSFYTMFDGIIVCHIGWQFLVNLSVDRYLRHNYVMKTQTIWRIQIYFTFSTF